MRTKLRSVSWIVASAAVALCVAGAAVAMSFDPPSKTSSKGDANSKSETKTSDKDKSDAAKSDKESTAQKTTTKDKKKVEKIQFNKLNSDEQYVILHKGTEPAFRGKYTDHFVEGTYICRHCNAPLYNSTDKFHSGCGWPSFDDEIKNSVKRGPDADGSGRIEITCANCGGHLGHVFEGEQLTNKNSRHCVNSISIVFVPKAKELPEVIRPNKSENESKDASSSSKATEVGSAKKPTGDAKSGASKPSKAGS